MCVITVSIQSSLKRKMIIYSNFVENVCMQIILCLYLQDISCMSDLSLSVSVYSDCTVKFARISIYVFSVFECNGFFFTCENKL